MRNRTGEPLLRKLLTYVSRDEARHTGYGIKYLNAVAPTLDARQRAEIEDFAFESARLLVDSRAGLSMRDSAMKLWADSGIDPAEALPALMKERETMMKSLARTGGRLGPVRGFVIPTLKAIGLFSDRIASHFDEMFAANVGPGLVRLADDPTAIPADLEAWVNEGHENL
jgi:rubrerythrin